MKRKATERAVIDDLDLSIVRPCRASLREEVIERYTEMVEDDPTGWPFATKVAVASVQGAPGLIVMDGQHRIEACKRAGVATVIVDTYEAESLDEAIRYARAANAKHGERLSREELRENILAYLRAGGDKESDSAIAAAFGIHRKTVAALRETAAIPSRKEAIRAAVEKAIQENPQAGSKALAKAAGVDDRAVRRLTDAGGQNGTFGQNAPLPPPQTAETCGNYAQVDDTSKLPPRRDAQPLPQRPAAVSQSGQNCQNWTPPPRRDAQPLRRVLKPETSQPKPDPKPIYDEVGHQVPPDLYEAWFAERKAVDDWLARTRAILREVKADAAGNEAAEDDEPNGFASLRFHQFTAAITNSLEVAISALKDVRPEALCTCKGYGCKRCHERGWMTQRQYRAIIPEDQQ